MRRYVELSGPLENGLWTYQALPGLEKIIPEVRIETIATVRENEFFASRLSMCTISGTYVEAGSHILEGARTLDRYRLKDFIKPARLLRLPAQKPKALIDEKLLASHAPGGIRPGQAILVSTGWGRRWNKPGYVLECPNFTKGAIAWLLKRKPCICGFDVPCIESSWSEDRVEEKGGLLGMLFRKGVLLVAPLVNLSRVKSDRGTLYCLPLPVVGTSGAPARVVFEERA
jgi:kynurenine formamidase